MKHRTSIIMSSVVWGVTSTLFTILGVFIWALASDETRSVPGAFRVVVLSDRNPPSVSLSLGAGTVGMLLLMISLICGINLLIRRRSQSATQ